MQRLSRWANKNLRGRKGQQGFTLIELLVVVTILGILAGIVTLSLVGLTTNASAQACNQEYRTVQAGLDAFMANQNLDTITALDQSPGGPVTYTNNMSTTLATVNGNNIGLYQLNLTPSNPTNYVRNQTTQYFYTWNASGRVTGIQNANGTAVPNCVPH
jgi:prepilin-type N-terminal cleavage/methylation domain-containing protein